MFSEMVDELAREADADVLGLWEICSRQREFALETSGRRTAVLGLCAALVARPEMRCCLYDAQARAFRVWPADAERALERIAAGYDAAAGDPEIGEVVYFATERYLNDLIDPPVVWPAPSGAS